MAKNFAKADQQRFFHRLSVVNFLSCDLAALDEIENFCQAKGPSHEGKESKVNCGKKCELDELLRKMGRKGLQHLAKSNRYPCRYEACQSHPRKKREERSCKY